MKTKAVLLLLYAVSLMVVLIQWRSAGRIMAIEKQAIAAYAKIPAKEWAAAPSLEVEARFVKIMGAMQGAHHSSFYQAQQQRLLLLLIAGLTLPMAVHVVGSLRVQKKS